ncbi:MAG TPA: hypothetical protein VF112_02865 [Candidatus Dormibacteraeota bacterium]
MAPPPPHHRSRPRRRHALRLTPFDAVVVSTEAVCAALTPRVHPVSCPGCAFDGGWAETPVTSEPTAPWQRGMRPISL